MTRHAPILVNEKDAAAMLAMTVKEFRGLVEGGHLPKPLERFPGISRWLVDELRSIATGQAARPDGGLEL